MEAEDIHIVLNITTVVLTAVIIIAAILAWRYIGKQKKNKNLTRKRHWIEQIPSLISTLGVLGTFIGITIGLIFFDTKNLDDSIPLLLSGLQTAFFTSLAGMIGSLLISRRVNSFYDTEDSGKNDVQKASEHIVNAIESMSNIQKEYNNKVFTRIEAIDRLSETLVDIKKSTVKGLDNLDGMNQSLSNIANGIDQMKDDIEEIKGHGNAVESQQVILNRIDESIKNTRTEITRLLAVTVTMTASVSKLDNALTDKKN